MIFIANYTDDYNNDSAMVINEHGKTISDGLAEKVFTDIIPFEINPILMNYKIVSKIYGMPGRSTANGKVEFSVPKNSFISKKDYKDACSRDYYWMVNCFSEWIYTATLESAITWILAQEDKIEKRLG